MKADYSFTSTMIRTMIWSDGDTLLVQFADGSMFRYSGVPKEVYQRVVKAKSVGKRFYALIRDSYPYQQVKGAQR